MKKIVLAGGTGNLGRLLTGYLLQNHYEVIVLSRSSKKSSTPHLTYVQWDAIHSGEWEHSLEGSYAIINLSGKSIQCRFTAENKKELYDSRILSTKAIGEAIAKLVHKPSLWINFSGVSLFNELSTLQDENSRDVGKGFLAELSRDWERAFVENTVSNVEKVVLRVSPVLLKDAGFYAELLPLVKLGLGGKVSNGNQMMNWIHYEDFARLVLWVLEQPAPSAIYHACTPNPISNKAFMQMFRKLVGVSLGLPLPRIMARIGAFAKGVDPSLLLDSVPVTTTKTIDDGFVFHYPDAKTSLEQLLKSTT